MRPVQIKTLSPFKRIINEAAAQAWHIVLENIPGILPFPRATAFTHTWSYYSLCHTFFMTDIFHLSGDCLFKRARSGRILEMQTHDMNTTGHNQLDTLTWIRGCFQTKHQHTNIIWKILKKSFIRACCYLFSLPHIITHSVSLIQHTYILPKQMSCEQNTEVCLKQLTATIMWKQCRGTLGNLQICHSSPVSLEFNVSC